MPTALIFPKQGLVYPHSLLEPGVPIFQSQLTTQFITGSEGRM